MSAPRLIVLLCLIFFVYPQNTLALSDDLMSVGELKDLIAKSKTGSVTGFFESVPRGNIPKKYDIDIRGVHNLSGIEMIVFTTRHKIVAGMSGSPVYVNGRLIGALAYRISNFNFDDLKWGGVSPIEKMMSDADGQISDNSGQKDYKNQMMTFEPIPLGYVPFPEDTVKVSGGFISLSSYDLSDVNMDGWDSSTIKPGMPIIVDLLEWEDERGNITLGGGVGTVTYIDKSGRIYAFGHPILNAKSATYHFRTCNILGTVFSEFNSFKFGGKISPVLGTIDFDSSYGVYGVFSTDRSQKLKHINLEFSRDGKFFKSFKIKIADMSLAPMLAADALKNIGSFNGAPLDGELSSTELTVSIGLDGYNDILWQDVYSPKEFIFGPTTLRQSSYKSAIDSFFQNLYPAIFRNDFNFKVNSVNIKADFISKQAKELRIAHFDFPKKVVWGENPILSITLISKDNSVAFNKKVEIDVSWDLVRKPIYDEDTQETDKDYQKKVEGSLSIYGSSRHVVSLSENERNIFYPEYFLNAQDFLDYLNRTLSLSGRSIFAKAKIGAREGLFEEIIASNNKIGYDHVENDAKKDYWTVIEGGISTRRPEIKNEGRVPFYVDLPLVPKGFVVADDTSDDFDFEVVLKKGLAEKISENREKLEKK